MSDAHNAVWDALRAQPTPITADTALTVGAAATVQAGQNETQFREWFEANSSVLLAKLNSY